MAVPSATAATATAAPMATTPPAPSAPPAFSPFGQEKKVDDSLLTDSDFQATNPLFAKKSGTDIPKGKKTYKRPKAYYRTPGIFGIVAASLNILAAIGLIIFLLVVIIGVAVSGEEGIAMVIGLLSLRLFLFAGFTIAGNIHAIVACMNLIAMTSRGASKLSIGEFLLNPVAYAILVYFDGGWIASLVTGGIFALWNWPAAIWVAIAVSGKQAKIDFEEVDSDELDELAAELQRRAAMKEGGH
ncbi:hypothetical protein [Roseimaritima sediminicola]|uniref:hypothetical protein n=1 Tax=Roseimaritima sediminicola TaxID=2662066 RepID=UPI0012983098|nr:hypothetical protein [Roseimaritima sediminicola]